MDREHTKGNGLPKRVLTASEIASELRCSKSHVFNLIHGSVKGLTVLPHIALGRRYVIPRAAFEAWKVANTAGKIVSDSDMNADGRGA
jgi:excisionase family DNA binding protein